jgi:hypothetical protein
MGSTLLINGQPLQIGQTGTIIVDVYSDISTSTGLFYPAGAGTPIVIPLCTAYHNSYVKGYDNTKSRWYIVNAEPITSFFLFNIVGTIILNNYDSGGFGRNLCFMYFYASPSTIYSVNNYFSISSICFYPWSIYNAIYTVTVSINNVIGFYAMVDFGSITRLDVNVKMNGTIIYTIVGTL